MTHADRGSSADGHIIIGGTGRAGTTLLVQYFTALGFDTGFTLERAVGGIDSVSKAGLEAASNRFMRGEGGLPYVAKSPAYGKNLTKFLETGELKIKHCIIPVRDLAEAAESRRRVTQEAIEAGGEPDKSHRGGIVGGPDAGPRQEKLLALRFFYIVQTMLKFDIPIHFLKFPEFARGEQDLFQALGPVLAEHGVTREEHEEALRAVLRPEYINDFAKETREAAPAGPPEPPAKPRRRGLRRLLG